MSKKKIVPQVLYFVISGTAIEIKNWGAGDWYVKKEDAIKATEIKADSNRRIIYLYEVRCVGKSRPIATVFEKGDG